MVIFNINVYDNCNSHFIIHGIKIRKTGTLSSRIQMAEDSPSHQFIHTPTIDFCHMVLVCLRWQIPRLHCSELDNVSPRYDVAELTKLAIGITWVTIVWAVLLNSLTIIRFTNGEIGIYHWARPRLIIICLGLLILTLPSTFDGLRILISASIILFCDFLSRFVPLSGNDN